MADLYRFGNFVVDARERRLLAGDAPVEVSARYFDALLLLVGEAGRLVSKERFMAEVWQGMPVTDEALTQCIRSLRRALGDSATQPRFIETVPKHGYRFVADVESPASDDVASAPVTVSPAVRERSPAPGGPASLPPAPASRWLLLGAAGTLGAGFAGLIGGVLFGFAGAAQPSGAGAASILVVLVCLTVLVALIGGAAVAFGIAVLARDLARPWRHAIPAGAVGGLAVGAVVKLLGLDAVELLLGQSPGDITGALEGFALGAAAGTGLWLAGRGRAVSPRRVVVTAGFSGALAGALIPLLGGRLMAGSLDQLARTFPDSRLRFDALGALFGEHGLGRVAEAATGSLEGALFAACLAGAMAAAFQKADA